MIVAAAMIGIVGVTGAFQKLMHSSVRPQRSDISMRAAFKGANEYLKGAGLDPLPASEGQGASHTGWCDTLQTGLALRGDGGYGVRLDSASGSLRSLGSMISWRRGASIPSSERSLRRALSGSEPCRRNESVERAIPILPSTERFRPARLSRTLLEFPPAAALNDPSTLGAGSQGWATAA